MSMTRARDPFERAVAKEERLRRKASVFESRQGMMRLIAMWFGAMGVAWAVVLVGHWMLFPEPRWLAVLHTVVFTLTAGCALFSFAFMTSMTKRRPDVFDE